MNKNLIEQDENDLLEIQPSGKMTFEDVAKPRFAETDAEENLLEIPEFALDVPDMPKITETPEAASETVNFAPRGETPIEEIEPETRSEEVEEPGFEARAAEEIEEIEEVEEVKESRPEAQTEKVEEIRPEIEIRENVETAPENHDEAFFQPPSAPESVGETVRQSGLAYGAAVTLFGSVIFMLFLGWLADWLLKTSPWGIVIGIVLGAVIGFYQFFRITSQIFKNKD